jgi:hypothetical protein
MSTVLLTVCLLPLAAAASSGRIESRDVRQGEVRVARGETVHDDIVASGPILVDGTAEKDCVSLGGGVTVNGRVKGDLVSLGGPAKIAGEVDGDVNAVGSPVVVSGSVGGDVFSMGGPVSLEPRAVVKGGVSTLGGGLTQADGSSIRGGISQMDLGLMGKLMPMALKFKPKERHSPDWIPRNLPFHWDSPWARAAGALAALVFLAGVGLMVVLLSAFLPKQVEAVAQAVETEFWKSAGIGALFFMLLLPGLLLMLVSILGIPLIPIALLLLCAAKLMAVAACSLLLARRFFASLQKPCPPFPVSVAAGYGLLVSLTAAGKLAGASEGLGSLVGGLFVFCNLMIVTLVLVVGLGAVWMTRLGTRPVGGSAGA